ncbi:fam-a protein [Plasmodium vinckei brucechwatti]|uniref:Fam-a protein n=1 Tax=Plasmodium vinckei brucechwatti TaxID=119398 RepID=A0A6V7RWA8_PLAVN|nr:fam-a protein [Plasmodium vinckei brucechwatti]
MLIFINDSPEELYEKNSHLLCTDPEETKKVEELMKEAITHFKYHSVYVDGYERYPVITDSCVRLYRKEHEGHTNVDKIEYSVWDANNFDPIINEIWDPDHATFFNAYSVKRKIVHVYSPNLVLIEQRYKKSLFGPYKYFYTLATKFEMSKYVTLIVMTSPDINDHYPSDKEYKNTIIENANLLKTDVDSEDDIRKGKLKKHLLIYLGTTFKNTTLMLMSPLLDLLMAIPPFNKNALLENVGIVVTFIYNHMFHICFHHLNIRRFNNTIYFHG